MSTVLQRSSYYILSSSWNQTGCLHLNRIIFPLPSFTLLPPFSLLPGFHPTLCFLAHCSTHCPSAFVGKYWKALGHLSKRPLKRNTHSNCTANSEAINQFVFRYRGLLSIALEKMLYEQQSNAVKELFIHTLLTHLINAYEFYDSFRVLS